MLNYPLLELKWLFHFPRCMRVCFSSKSMTHRFNMFESFSNEVNIIFSCFSPDLCAPHRTRRPSSFKEVLFCICQFQFYIKYDWCEDCYIDQTKRHCHCSCQNPRVWGTKFWYVPQNICAGKVWVTPHAWRFSLLPYTALQYASQNKISLFACKSLD